MEGKIYVITHKKVHVPMIEGMEEYELVQTGDNNAPDLGYTRAALGSEIAEDNEYYADMTVHYWAWKNIKCDFVGINQYRRFLYYRNHIITKRDIEELLGQYEILLPQKLGMYVTVEQQWNMWHHPEDLRLAFDIMIQLYPEYIDAYKQVMNSTAFHICNMFIAKKSVFDAYCEWIFPIISRVRPKINLEQYETIDAKRVGGFLSERLFNVWLVYNRPSSCELDFRVFSKEQFEEKLKEK